jgi:hypothetical protein
MIGNKFKWGMWNIGIVTQNIESIIENPGDIQIKWMKHSYRDRFFADPFLYDQDDDNYYILAEEFIYYIGVGSISLLTIDKKTMKLKIKETFLKENYHLSFPNKYDNYIITESYRSGATYIYTKFKDGFKKRKLTDHRMIDPVVFEKDSIFWIFASDPISPLDQVNIYYYGKDRMIREHKMNPVKKNIKNSRPAGKIFYYKDDIIRPVQDSEKCYGNMVRLMKIIELTTSTFAEEEVCAISSEFNPPYDQGLHTFNVYDDCIIVDGYREYNSWIVKPICVKLTGLMRLIHKKYNIDKGKMIYD